MKIIERKTSRISDAELVELFSLGNLYMSDFVSNPNEKRPQVPLTLALDTKSGLLQLKHTAPFEQMYEHYWYRSGINKTMKEELKGIVKEAISLIKLKDFDVVLDIGCNDGTLLSYYPSYLIKIGIDPAKNLREYALKHADMIVTDYFSAETYPYKTKKAKIITSIAMFYDLEEPDKFVDDINKVLDDEGLWIIQMSYLPLMLQQMAFDNICHEHLEYYSLTSLKYLLDKHDMKIVDVKLNDVNGGSFRIYIRKNKADDNLFATSPYREVAKYRVKSILEYEKTLNLNNPQTYIDWFEQIKHLKEETVKFIKEEKKKGKKIWGYGASTKGNTLLQFYGLDNSLIDAIADRNPVKWGKYTVGTNIPIVSEDEMREKNPDYLLILPWAFIYEFKNREKEYLEKGGKFILPCPKFEIIGR